MFLRFVFFLGIWCVFDGIKPAGLAIGVVAAALATWTSLLLIPAWPWRVRILPLLALAAHFVWSSIVAAVEVAWLAFRPRLALQPGFVTCQCGIPAGPARDLFLSMISLMPGSAPVAEEGANEIVMHCLDVRQPVAAQMADNEKRFRQACELVEPRP